MSLEKLTKDWTEDDFKKFWRWTEKQLKEKPREWWLAVDLPDHHLKAKDRIRATYMKLAVYKKVQEFDKEHRLRRLWRPILMDEILIKETASRLNSLFSRIREHYRKANLTRIDSSNSRLLLAILWGVIYLKQYTHDTSPEPVKLEELLDSTFLDFLLRGIPETLRVAPKLVPQETNLIELPMWSPTTRGISEDQIVKRGTVTIEVEGNFGLPTVFTFEIAAVLQGIWQEQGYSDIFYTSLSEVCKRTGIPTDHRNRELVLNAIYRLHNTWFSAPFWIKDESGKTSKKMIYKINVIQIEAQEIRPGRHHTLELRLNTYLADNVRRGRFTLFDIRKMTELSSPTAKRLYSFIERQKGGCFQRKLSKLKGLLVLRGKRYRQSIEKGAQELIDTGYLEKYEIQPGKSTSELVFRAWKAETKIISSSIKGE